MEPMETVKTSSSKIQQDIDKVKQQMIQNIDKVLTRGSELDKKIEAYKNFQSAKFHKPVVKIYPNRIHKRICITLFICLVILLILMVLIILCMQYKN